MILSELSINKPRSIFLSHTVEKKYKGNDASSYIHLTSSYGPLSHNGGHQCFSFMSFKLTFFFMLLNENYIIFKHIDEARKLIHMNVKEE